MFFICIYHGAGYRGDDAIVIGESAYSEVEEKGAASIVWCVGEKSRHACTIWCSDYYCSIAPFAFSSGPRKALSSII